MRLRLWQGYGPRPHEGGAGGRRAGRSAVAMAAALTMSVAGCAARMAGLGDGRSDASSEESRRLVADLILHDRGAIAFHERTVPPDDLQEILAALRPYASLCEWKVVVVTDRDNRIAVLEAMQMGYLRAGRPRAAEIMERWKAAPVMLVFCVPERIPPFGGVPPELMQGQALIELGAGVQSLILVARTYGVETHWIASALLVEDEISNALGIPGEYRVAFFGVAGYASEESAQQHAPLEDICYRERWPKERSVIPVP